MKVIISDAARWEQQEAVAWYREKSPKLPKRFRAELKATLRRVAAGPLQFPIVVDDYRQALLAVFPYAVIFEISDRTVLVIAIAHLSRFPAYWAQHIPNRPAN